MIELELSELNIVLSVVGAFLIVFGIISHKIKKSWYLGEALPAMLMGVILGPKAAKFIEPARWISAAPDELNDLTLGVCRVAIGVQLVIVGFQLPAKYQLLRWKEKLIGTLPVMTIMWLATALCIFAIIPNLTMLSSLVIGACLACTDPIMSQAMAKGAFAEEHIPRHLRDMMTSEAGANDSFSFPSLMLATFLIRHADKGTGEQDAEIERTDTIPEALKAWVLETLLYTILMGIVYGAIVGYASCMALKVAVRRRWIDIESLFLFPTAIGVTLHRRYRWRHRHRRAPCLLRSRQRTQLERAVPGSMQRGTRCRQPHHRLSPQPRHVPVSRLDHSVGHVQRPGCHVRPALRTGRCGSAGPPHPSHHALLQNAPERVCESQRGTGAGLHGADRHCGYRCHLPGRAHTQTLPQPRRRRRRRVQPHLGPDTHRFLRRPLLHRHPRPVRARHRLHLQALGAVEIPKGRQEHPALLRDVDAQRRQGRRREARVDRHLRRGRFQALLLGVQDAVARRQAELGRVGCQIRSQGVGVKGVAAPFPLILLQLQTIRISPQHDFVGPRKTRPSSNATALPGKKRRLCAHARRCYWNTNRSHSPGSAPASVHAEIVGRTGGVGICRQRLPPRSNAGGNMGGKHGRIALSDFFRCLGSALQRRAARLTLVPTKLRSSRSFVARA